MIQRIQTVYLILSILSGLTALVLNLIAGQGTIAVDAFNSMEYLRYAYLGLIVLGVAIASWSIFMYNNRMRQICFVDISTLSLVLGCILIVASYFINKCEASWAEVSIYLPVVSIIFNMLAKSRIKYDENLVRSADRLR